MFETEKEMLESSDIIKNFDLDGTKKLADEIGNKRVIITGMGSGVLFPGNNAKIRAMMLNIKNRVEVYFASDLLSFNDFSDSYVILCSNSGMTKETIILLDHIKNRGAKSIAVTAVPNSILAKKCSNNIIMKCGFEKGVAATKSVIETALILDSLIINIAKNQGNEIDLKKIKKMLVDTSSKVKWNINVKVSEYILKILAESNSLYFVGRQTGVAEEITLKSYEIVRKSAIFYPGTQMLHGIEESIEANPIIIFEPSKLNRFMNEFKRFSKRTNCKLFGIDNQNNIDGVKIKSNLYFENYCLLTGGWGLLRCLAKRQKINIDNPKKIQKVGNPHKED